jgi:uncharacterized protein with PIN domain
LKADFYISKDFIILYINYKFLNLLNFLKHFLKKFECPICNKRFRKIEESMQHEQVIHGSSKYYTCNSCNRQFLGMEQMRDHIKKKHQYKGERKNNKKS